MTNRAEALCVAASKEPDTNGRFRPNAETVQFFCHRKIFSSLNGERTGTGRGCQNASV